MGPVENYEFVQSNYKALRDELDQKGFGPVEILAVSKTFPRSAVDSLLTIGVRSFGENRAQELKDKFNEHENPEIHLHFLGHLQTNKARIVVSRCSWVDSVDSLKVVQTLQAALVGTSKIMNVLIEVNTSGEEQKAGVQTIDEVYELLSSLRTTPNLKPRGLMTLGPLTDQRDRIRGSFKKLATMYEEVRRSGIESWDTLSMGMSNDYPLALDEGSTIIRIGTALFGRRL